jgi:prolyl oligopeptidase
MDTNNLRNDARQPVARIEPVQEVYFGQSVIDPYRWMEQIDDPDMQDWIQGQAAFTESFLDEHTDRDVWLSRVSQATAAQPQLKMPRLMGNKVFYLARMPEEEYYKLIVRSLPNGSENILIDPNSWPLTIPTAIDWFVPSWDGQRVAYGISEAGTEDSTLRIVEVDSLKIHDLSIPHVREGYVTWFEDNRSFLYLKFPAPTSETSASDYYLNSATFLHRLDDPSLTDQLILGAGTYSNVTIEREDMPVVTIVPDSPWLLAVIRHGVQSELTILVADRNTLVEPGAITWTLVADVDDAVTEYCADQDTIYLLTYLNALNLKVVATSLNTPNIEQARVVVPESSAVLEQIEVYGHTLLVRELNAGIGFLRRVEISSNSFTIVPLPISGTVLDWSGEVNNATVILQLTSWTEPPHIYFYSTSTGEVTDPGWSESTTGADLVLETREVYTRANDGTSIPISIIFRQGMKLDGNNPAILFGYGAYGISASPRYMPAILPWYEHGGVYAIAHIRGGGENGVAWHHAGRLNSKQTTIDDFIACAEYLVAEGYTRPELLAAEGVSAGGIAAAGALVQRPDLWGAAILIVPLTNLLRFEFSENGPMNVPEFGSVETEKGFTSLYAIDPYTNIKDNVPYPPVLVATGANDMSAPTWDGMKFAARLQTATVSGNPILLRVDFEAGHGAGSTKRQSDSERADVFAFVVHQFGLTRS